MNDLEKFIQNDLFEASINAMKMAYDHETIIVIFYAEGGYKTERLSAPLSWQGYDMLPKGSKVLDVPPCQEEDQPEDMDDEEFYTYLWQEYGKELEEEVRDRYRKAKPKIDEGESVKRRLDGKDWF